MPWPKKSEDHKRKISETRIRQSVESFNLATGKTIKIYASIKEAEQDGFHRPSIYKVLNGQRQSVNGLGWRYLTKTEPPKSDFANKPFE